MVIIIGGYGANGYGANGNGVLHWCHYVHYHWSQWIAIGTIFYRHWRQWRKPQIDMTLLPENFLNYSRGLEFLPSLKNIAPRITEIKSKANPDISFYTNTYRIIVQKLLGKGFYF